MSLNKQVFRDRFTFNWKFRKQWVVGKRV